MKYGKCHAKSKKWSGFDVGPTGAEIWGKRRIWAGGGFWKIFRKVFTKCQSVGRCTVAQSKGYGRRLLSVLGRKQEVARA